MAAEVRKAFLIVLYILAMPGSRFVPAFRFAVVRASDDSLVQMVREELKAKHRGCVLPRFPASLFPETHRERAVERIPNLVLRAPRREREDDAYVFVLKAAFAAITTGPSNVSQWGGIRLLRENQGLSTT